MNAVSEVFVFKNVLNFTLRQKKSIVGHQILAKPQSDFTPEASANILE